MNTFDSGFYITGGTLRSDAPSYLERRADHELIDGLRRGEFCYVLTSRQMGKSSLMVRTAMKLREEGAQVAVLDLTAIGQNLSPEQWYDGMLMRLARQLRLEDELEKFWAEHKRLGPVQRFFQALRDVVLARRDGSIVIFVDEIDVVRSLPFPSDEFFAAIRECYNARTVQPALNRLSFCLLGVAAPSDLIRDTRMTPFNIGRRIELNDFTPEEAQPLARGLAAGGQRNDHQARVTLARVLHWTHGHPYLTQRFCQALASRPVNDRRAVDKVCNELFLSNRAREQDDNLLFVRDRLMRGQTDPAGLLLLYADALQGRPPVMDDAAHPLAGVLRLSGIVRSENGQLRVRNAIYARVFDRKWIDANMPDAELRRQRAAYYRGVIRTTAIAAVVVVALTAAVLAALHQAAQARQSLAKAYFSQAQTRRVSGMAGQRQESLNDLQAARRDFGDPKALRDEAIACLALTDLEGEWAHTNLPPGTTAVALVPPLESYALGDVNGAIHIIRRADGRAETDLPGDGLPVSWLVASPGGRFLAAAYQGNGRQRFVVWWVTERRAVFESEDRLRETAVDFSGDNSQVALGTARGEIKVLSLPEGRVLASLNQPQATGSPRDLAAVRFDPSGLQLAESSFGSLHVRVWNLARKGSSNYLYHLDEGTLLAWTPDGQHLAAAGHSTLRVWDMDFGRRRDLALSLPNGARDVAFSPQGDLIASVDAGRSLHLWCPATSRRVTLALDAEPSGRVCFSADGRRLGLAGVNTGVRVWRVRGNAEYRVFRAPPEINIPLTSLAFDPEGRVLAAASDLGVFFWDTVTGRALASLPLHSVRSIGIHSKSGDLFASTPEGLFWWPRTAQGPRHRYGPAKTLGLPGGLERCTLASEGKTAVVVHGSHLHQFQIEAPFDDAMLGLRGSFQELVLSPDGRWLATWSESQTLVQVWSMQQRGTNPSPITAFNAGRHLAFSPDSRHLLASSTTGHHLWDTQERTATVLPGLPAATRDAAGPVAFVRVAGDGRTLLATADEGGVVRLFQWTGTVSRTSVPQLLARLDSPDRSRALALAFDPQGSRLAAATTEQTVQVWDLAAVGRSLHELGIESRFPKHPHDTPESPAASIEIRLDPPPQKPAEPDQWMKIESLTLALEEPAYASPLERAKLLADRGTVFRNRLNRAAQAEADFAEALRLAPDDKTLRKNIDEARRIPQVAPTHP